MASPESLVKVVAELILHPGVISERFDAAVKYLALLTPDDFPRSARSDWEGIDTDIKKAGSIPATFRELTDLEFVELARRLWDLQVAADAAAGR